MACVLEARTKWVLLIVVNIEAALSNLIVVPVNYVPNQTFVDVQRHLNSTSTEVHGRVEKKASIKTGIQVHWINDLVNLCRHKCVLQIGVWIALTNSIFEHLHVGFVNRVQWIAEAFVEDQVLLMTADNPQWNLPRFNRMTRVFGAGTLLSVCATANHTIDARFSQILVANLAATVFTTFSWRCARVKKIYIRSHLQSSASNLAVCTLQRFHELIPEVASVNWAF
jgi:hypothetical protein